MQRLIDRLCAWQEKALREAKRHSDWVAPNEAYEEACRHFLTQMLDPARPSRLGDEFRDFAVRIGAAGAINGLAQTVLRLTVPGVPDLYQGTELWDFSLVDPDNRRPVDYALREAYLGSMRSPAELLANWTTGQVKHAVVARLLALRARYPALFAHGKYTPLKLEGARADHLIAFMREDDDGAILVLATRLSASLLETADIPLVDPARWQGTRVAVPDRLVGRRCADVLGGSAAGEAGTTIEANAAIAVGALLARLPVAVLDLH